MELLIECKSSILTLGIQCFTCLEVPYETHFLLVVSSTSIADALQCTESSDKQVVILHYSKTSLIRSHCVQFPGANVHDIIIERKCAMVY